MTYLEDNPLGDHVAAFEREDWPEFLRLVREEPPQSMSEVAVFEDLLDEYATLKLPSSREKWDQRVGAFIAALGHAPAGTTASDFFASQWDWQRTSEQVALDIAQDNLHRAACKGAKLTTQYVSELISTAWRDDALARLRSIAQAEPQRFFETACWAPQPVDGRVIPDSRLQLLYELAERAGGFEATAVLLDGDFWWELWRAFSAGRTGEDVTRYALELISKRL